jgi:hypothetical protein
MICITNGRNKKKSSSLDIRMPFVVGGTWRIKKTPPSRLKTLYLRLNNEPAKYFDQAKAIWKYKAR